MNIKEQINSAAQLCDKVSAGINTRMSNFLIIDIIWRGSISGIYCALFDECLKKIFTLTNRFIRWCIKVMNNLRIVLHQFRS